MNRKSLIAGGSFAQEMGNGQGGWTLHAGNVLLKPSQKKQVMAWLRRALRLGQRIGDFMLTLSLHRIGRGYEVQARVHDSAGDFGLRTRQSDWREAIRQIVSMLTRRLHDQRLGLALATR